MAGGRPSLITVIRLALACLRFIVFWLPQLCARRCVQALFNSLASLLRMVLGHSSVLASVCNAVAKGTTPNRGFRSALWVAWSRSLVQSGYLPARLFLDLVASLSTFRAVARVSVTSVNLPSSSLFQQQQQQQGRLLSSIRREGPEAETEGPAVSQGAGACSSLEETQPDDLHCNADHAAPLGAASSVMTGDGSSGAGGCRVPLRGHWFRPKPAVLPSVPSALDPRDLAGEDEVVLLYVHGGGFRIGNSLANSALFELVLHMWDTMWEGQGSPSASNGSSARLPKPLTSFHSMGYSHASKEMLGDSNGQGQRQQRPSVLKTGSLPTTRSFSGPNGGGPASRVRFADQVGPQPSHPTVALEVVAPCTSSNDTGAVVLDSAFTSQPETSPRWSAQPHSPRSTQAAPQTAQQPFVRLGRGSVSWGSQAEVQERGEHAVVDGVNGEWQSFSEAAAAELDPFRAYQSAEDTGHNNFRLPKPSSTGALPASSVVQSTSLLSLRSGAPCPLPAVLRPPKLAIFSLDYDLAPEHPWPRQLQQTLEAYKWLLQQGHSRILLGGDSAGGNLVLTCAIVLRDSFADLPQPLGVLAFSPWTDLATDPSTYADVDADILSWDPERHGEVVRSYLGPHYRELASHPHVSPHHAELAGLPPLWINAGGAELLLHDIDCFVDKAQAAGVDVEYEKGPGMYHGYVPLHPLMGDAEGFKGLCSAVRFMQRAVGPPGSP